MQSEKGRIIRVHNGPPIVCQLSGEDLFLEKLPPPHYEQARNLLRVLVSDVDAFVAINNYYADFMADYLSVDRSKVHVIPHGVSLDGHGTRVEKQPHELRIVGYLARICEDKGLHILVEACERLVERRDVPTFKLHAAGYLGEGDRPYLENLQQRVATGPLTGRFEYVGELDRIEKIAFLQSLD